MIIYIQEGRSVGQSSLFIKLMSFILLFATYIGTYSVRGVKNAKKISLLNGNTARDISKLGTADILLSLD